jgi:hypothetical protein
MAAQPPPIPAHEHPEPPKPFYQTPLGVASSSPLSGL